MVYDDQWLFLNTNKKKLKLKFIVKTCDVIIIGWIIGGRVRRLDRESCNVVIYI